MSDVINVAPQTGFSGVVTDLPFTASYVEDGAVPCRGRYCRDSVGRVYQEVIYGSGNDTWTSVLIKDPAVGRAYFTTSDSETLTVPYTVVVPGGWWFPGLNPVQVGTESISGVPCARYRLTVQRGADCVSDVWISEELVCVMREDGERASEPYVWAITEITMLVEPDIILFRPTLGG